MFLVTNYSTVQEDWARHKANLLSLIVCIGEREVVILGLKKRRFS